MPLPAACLLVSASLLAQAGAAPILRVEPDNTHALQEALIEIAQQRLLSTGLLLDREHAWLEVDGKLPGGEVRVLPAWSSDGAVPALPLVFELRPAAGANGAPPVRATLAVRLRRSVLVAQRHLAKGSGVSCSDFAPALREIGAGSRAAPVTTCGIEAGDSALRDLAPGDALRAGDVGRAPEVRSGAPVQLRASNGGIVVTTTAVALADARTGDEIDVRLQHPARTLRTRVVGRGAVQLADEAP